MSAEPSKSHPIRWILAVIVVSRHRRVGLHGVRSVTHRFAGGKTRDADRVYGRRSHRRSGGTQIGESHRARRVSGARGGLRGLPHRRGRRAVCGRPRLRACRSEPCIPPISRPIRPPASAGIRTPISSTPCTRAWAATAPGCIRPCRMPATPTCRMPTRSPSRRTCFRCSRCNAPAPSNTLAFPFNQRGLMGIWAAMFNPDRRFEPSAERSAQWNRGAYLAEAMGHCGECHTPRNLFFALNNRQKFAGAVQAGWRAYNITPDQEQRRGRMERCGSRALPVTRTCGWPRHRFGSNGRSCRCRVSST